MNNAVRKTIYAAVGAMLMLLGSGCIIVPYGYETVSQEVIGMRFLATHMCFSIDKARRDLGYQPHCSPEEAIEENARWAAEQRTGRRF